MMQDKLTQQLNEAELRKETCEMHENNGKPLNQAAYKDKIEATMVIAAIKTRLAMRSR